MKDGSCKIAASKKDSFFFKLIDFYSRIKEPQLKDLTQFFPSLNKNKDAFFRQVYEDTRSDINTRLILDKFLDLMDTWIAKGEKEKISYFYSDEIDYIGM